MKLAIAATLVASAAAFAPSAPVISRASSTSLYGSYNVKLISEEEGIDTTIECSDDVFILDAAEEEGIDLPYSCRAGSCSSCLGKITDGTINQEDQTFLDEDQMAEGWVMTCVAYPTSDCTILVHEEDNLYG